MTRQGALSRWLQTSVVSWFFLREPQNSQGMEGRSCRDSFPQPTWTAPGYQPFVRSPALTRRAAFWLCFRFPAAAAKRGQKPLRGEGSLGWSLLLHRHPCKRPLCSVYTANAPQAAELRGCTCGAGWPITTRVSPASWDRVRGYSYLGKCFHPICCLPHSQGVFVVGLLHRTRVPQVTGTLRFHWWRISGPWTGRKGKRGKGTADCP